MKANANKFENYGEKFSLGSRIGYIQCLLTTSSCCIDFSNCTISYTRNGEDLGVAFTNVNPNVLVFLPS